MRLNWFSSKRRMYGALVGALLFSCCVYGHAAVVAPTSRIRLYNTHTGKRLDLVYRIGDVFVPAALAELECFLGDYRNGHGHPFDPALFDVLSDLAREVGRNDAEFHVISGYRSPETNEMLAATRTGVAKHSLHMQARAIDIRLPGTPTAKLRDAAIGMRRGGVGYYRALDFIHVDTGPVRRW
jgi:uncharacterized protein YcbK (DUF882 family)